MGDEITQGGAGALQFEGFGKVNNEHVGQFGIGGFKRAQPLAAFDVGHEGIGYEHVLHLRLVEAVAEFVDEVAKTFALKGCLEGFADDALGGCLVHWVLNPLRQV